MTVKDKTGKGITIQLPSLVGTQEFTPTGLMIKTLCAYLQGLEHNKVIQPYQFLKSQKHSPTNWYDWQKKVGFIQWWKRAIEDFHTNIGLVRVYNRMYQRALDNSPQDTKMVLERFDRDYKPATATEHSFKGIEPPEQLDGAVERSRQRAEGRKQVDNEVIEERADNGI